VRFRGLAALEVLHRDVRLFDCGHLLLRQRAFRSSATRRQTARSTRSGSAARTAQDRRPRHVYKTPTCGRGLTYQEGPPRPRCSAACSPRTFWLARAVVAAAASRSSPTPARRTACSSPGASRRPRHLRTRARPTPDRARLERPRVAPGDRHAASADHPRRHGQVCPPTSQPWPPVRFLPPIAARCSPAPAGRPHPAPPKRRFFVLGAFTSSRPCYSSRPDLACMPPSRNSARIARSR